MVCFFFATADTQVIILQVASDGSMFCHLSTYSSSGSLSPLLTAPPLSTHGRWPADLPAARAGGRLLQGHREDRGLPGLDHRHRREGQPDGAHHRQAAADRGARQGERRRAVVVGALGEGGPAPPSRPRHRRPDDAARPNRDHRRRAAEERRRGRGRGGRRRHAGLEAET